MEGAKVSITSTGIDRLILATVLSALWPINSATGRLGADARSLAAPERKERLSEQRARAGENKQRQEVAEHQVQHTGNRTPEVHTDPRAGAGATLRPDGIARNDKSGPTATRSDSEGEGSVAGGVR